MEVEGILIVATAITGFISLSKTLITFFRWVWVTLLRPPKNLTDYGSWALVTGATGGIGSAIAFQLASKGLNLVLVDRDLSTLRSTADKICQQYGTKIEVKCVVMDFLKVRNEEIVMKIQEETEGLDVGLVINNAGMAYDCPTYFHEIESELMHDIIRVNLDGASWVIKAVLPMMMKKKKGAIINMGSASGSSSIVPSLPFYTLYAATKAYIAMLSKSISLEYKQHGIEIQCQTPMLVATKITPMKRSSFFVPSPEVFSKASVRFMGYESACIPYWTHGFQWCLHSAVPEALFDRILHDWLLRTRERGVYKIFGFEL